jgi:aryl sulfotransferase
MRDYRNIVSDNRRWLGFQHRLGDVVVATPPKCGTTWMQTIVATLLFPTGDLPAPVMVLAPWIDMRRLPIDDVLAGLEAQQHRRAMKTIHRPTASPGSRLRRTSWLVVMAVTRSCRS